MTQLINAIIFLPAIGAVAVLLLPRQAARILALLVSLITAGCALVLASQYDPQALGSLLSIKSTWLPELGASYEVAVDGLNLPLILLTALLTPLVLIGSWAPIEGSSEQQKSVPAMILLMETGALGTFLSQDLLLFYVFWELILIPAYLLVGVYGAAERARATLQFFLYTFGASLLMLLGIAWLIYQHKVAFGLPSASFADLQKLQLPFSSEGTLGGLLTVQGLLFAAFAAAFFVKAPLFPFHGWMALTYTQAPIAVTVYLAAILSKMGTYGILKFMIPLFPQAMHAFAPYLMWLAAIGVIYGALLALAQKNMKTALAYSSLSHVSYILLGLFSLEGAGMAGALLQMVNHGIVIAGLFFIAYGLERRRGSQLLADFGGWARSAPLLSSFFMLFVLSSVALPGTNGFVGEFMVLIASFRSAPLPTSLAAGGMVLGAFYMLNIYQRLMFGPSAGGPASPRRELGFAELTIVAILGAAVIGIGVAPQPYLSVSSPAIEGLQKRLVAPQDVAAPAPQVSSTQKLLSP